MNRRDFVAGSAAAAAALTIRPAFAEDAYPSHAITIINPFPPGGASDVVTRPLAAVLEPIVKQPVVMATRCCRTSRRFPASPKWTSCSAGR
jgi:tripartite-type tricarboxylate transporter receptor subunit TctC